MDNVSAVDLEGMNRLATGHQTAIEAGHSSLNTLGGHAEALGGTWSGAAASSYQNALATVQEKGAKLLNTQQNILDLVKRTGNTQSNTHESTLNYAGQAGQIAEGMPTGLPGL
ncbi:MAG TPA: WXG100 family type VII secretion target [Amycolatopsis sp.]|jgi:uncharacterized protein YukE|nr:WXG100 family type VII secretion target [Amycolatopsis sp.]